MSEQKAMKYLKEAFVIVGISTGIGFLFKKVLKKSVTNDPTTSIINALEWTAVMTTSIYARGYLIDQKIIPQ